MKTVFMLLFIAKRTTQKLNTITCCLLKSAKQRNFLIWACDPSTCSTKTNKWGSFNKLWGWEEAWKISKHHFPCIKHPRKFEFVLFFFILFNFILYNHKNERRRICLNQGIFLFFWCTFCSYQNFISHFFQAPCALTLLQMLLNTVAFEIHNHLSYSNNCISEILKYGNSTRKWNNW